MQPCQWAQKKKMSTLSQKPAKTITFPKATVPVIPLKKAIKQNTVYQKQSINDSVDIQEPITIQDPHTTTATSNPTQTSVSSTLRLL